uniref:Uncharacterized protein n=1 Tax=Pristionchus pacificus TaxID=54126 RepID=A0A2A6CV27_PRIPA
MLSNDFIKTHYFRAPDGAERKVNVIHVNTVEVDSHAGTNLPKLDSDFVLDMMFVGITNKHDLFANAQSFDAFPGEFTQSYDPEVALLDLVNTFGSDTKPVTPSLDNYPLCTKMLQAAFAFHTDISSVPRSAQKIFQSVTKYFDIPDVKQIYQDDDTCEFNTDQLEDKTQFTGTMYANSTTFGVETFCNSNMDVYPELIPTSDYKQAAQVMLQKLDTVPVSFAGSDVVGFKHIVMPFGFSYEDSPLWRSLVPDQSQWTRDASLTDYDVDAIIQDIWTITCRMAGHIESSETAEPVNPYTTKKPRIKLLLLLGLVLSASAQSCSNNVPCPTGFMCDTNTLVCRQFRTPGNGNGNNNGLCTNVFCNPGTMCDSNTGRCVTFRTPSNGASRCAGVQCPTNYQCDANTGRCVQFRDPGSRPGNGNRCGGVYCLGGYTCDTNTGRCVLFRTPGGGSTIQCTTSANCPSGTACDANTGRCVAFRNPTSVTSFTGTGKCASVICPDGLTCDSNTGLCQQFRSSSSTCQAFRAPYRRAVRESQLNSLCRNRVCAQPNAVCDENTGKCVLVTDLCQFSSCPPGFLCDPSTGQCSRQTRQAAYQCPGLCPQGTSCDENTGRCTQFRPPADNGGSFNRCNGVQCPTGSSCDSNSGRCVPFRNPGGSVCSQQCPQGTSCDENTGICRQFRPPAGNPPQQTTTLPPYNDPAGYCNGVRCPQGTSCDTNTGICRQFRPPADNGGVRGCSAVTCPAGYSCNPLIGICMADNSGGNYNDPCTYVTCPSNYQCDSNTGYCVQMRNPGNRCASITCPSGSACDASSGLCRMVVYNPDKCTGVQCNQGTSCDSNTGICRQFRPPAFHSLSSSSSNAVVMASPTSQTSSATEKDLCSDMQCPRGTRCNNVNGICERISCIPTSNVTSKSINTEAPVVSTTNRTDLCANIRCRNGATCDPNSGLCLLPSMDRCANIRCSGAQKCADGVCVTPKCFNVNCPTGTACSPVTGQCESFTCPDNSHFVECSSPCPASCGNTDSRCTSQCIPSCECNAGFIQASRTNMTCIERTACAPSDSCTGIRCSGSMVCESGFCNPVNCPPLRKPPMKLRCDYGLKRDSRNCLYISLECAKAPSTQNGMQQQIQQPKKARPPQRRYGMGTLNDRHLPDTVLYSTH